MLKFQGLSVRLTVLTAFLTIARADGFQGTEEKVGCFVDCLITPRTTITRAFTHSDQMPWRQHHLGFSRQRRKRLHCFLGMSDLLLLEDLPGRPRPKSFCGLPFIIITIITPAFCS
jgi:hypothetical protein